MVKKGQKIFESLEATASRFYREYKVMLAQYLLEFELHFPRENLVRSNIIYNGEFDPGSG